jgi:signal transduction histidine kinase
MPDATSRPQEDTVRAAARPGRVARVVGAGVLVAALVFAAGRALVAWQLGDDAAVRRALEQDARRHVAGIVERLQRLAGTLARQPEVRAGLRDATEAPRRLFAVLDAAVDPEVDGPALTTYDAAGRPIAWAGRPSELPADRVLAGANLFVAQASLGLRLVAIEPIAESATSPRRIGTMAAEAPLSAAVARGPRDSFVVDTGYGPVIFSRSFVASEGPPHAFVIRAPSGAPLLQATIADDAPAQARARWRGRTDALALGLLALTVAIAAAVIAIERQAGRDPRRRFAATLLALAFVALGWALISLAAARASAASAGEVAAVTWYTLAAGASTPAHLTVTGLALVSAILLLVDPARRAILARRGRRRSVHEGAGRLFAFALHVLAGLAVVVLEVAVFAVVQDAERQSAASLVRFSLAPWDGPRLARLAGLILLQTAAFWGGVVVCRLSLARWRWDGGAAGRWLIPLAWALPSIAVGLFAPVPIAGVVDFARGPVVAAGVAVAVVAWITRRGVAWFRHGSQASRLGWLLIALLAPAWLLYPVLVDVVERAKTRLVEQEYAAQVRRHPEDLRASLRSALAEIDRFPDRDRDARDNARELAALIASSAGRKTASAEPAFTVWRATDLEEARLTSAIELYGRDGVLVSRFALNFPEAEVVPLRNQASSCDWEVFGEVQPFGADERRMLHAERALCVTDAQGRPSIAGAVVAYVMLDYSALSFISSQSPYYEFFRAPRTAREGTPGGDVELTVFGWGRLPFYTSLSRSWLLTDDVFEAAYRARTPFWTTLARGDGVDRVYVSNDRYAIYLVGYPILTAYTHVVNLGELTAFAAVMFAVLVVLASLVRGAFGAGGSPLPLVVQEIRASFYRKLFIAFVAATLVPVLALALLVRASVASQLRADAEAGAARTALTAKRVIEESLALQERELATATGGLSDDVMVWISRIIDQDVNIFEGSQLLVTSERDLFASGLLPTRTPAQVQRAVAVERLPTYVGQDRIGDFTYLVAAAPVRIGGRDAILTVPLASRQREIEREIADLDRAVLLGALVLILLGAGLGYWMAERIGDPVQRLTRATRRIAAGDLSTRVIVRTADELQRLVEAFNRMAGELQRQRSQVERTHRLEAWAEMARQVAHDIKNPLTPIQLSAEHLRRVHHDRGEPLSPVLDTCVDTILTQVRLLRQIAAEFSSFGSSPIARPTPTAVGDLLHEVVDPYQLGVGERIAITLDVEPGLPLVTIDRMLIARAITNILENALHAMPGSGRLTVTARAVRDRLVLTVTDTGVGMDAEASARIFEPYFSTKASGTGLGLSIARRNVEMNGGTIGIASARGAGTTVTIALPLAAPRPAAGDAAAADPAVAIPRHPSY